MASAYVAHGTGTDAAASTRLVSLDVFRGVTMAAMVIVNNPGDWDHVYAPLRHAEWNGWTPTDLIFPFFVFIVGVSITFSKRSLGWGTILKRGALIFALGLLLNARPDWATWRIPGVLQRIAICYVVAAAVFKVTVADRKRQALLVACAAFVTIATYYLLLTLVAPPGGVRGDLSPEGNLGAHIDRALFGTHMWQPRWDPEGLLSSLPAIGTALLGVLAGLWLRSTADPGRKAALLALAGAAGIVAGYAWHPWFPINKNLWTSSFVLFTAGAGSLLLAALYWVIDVRGFRRGTKPFVILGTNAIALYVASALLAEMLGFRHGGETSAGAYVYGRLFVRLASPNNASLLFAVAHLLILFVLLAWMYRRRIFLRL